MNNNITRESGNIAIDNFIIGGDAWAWTHKFITNEAVPACDLENKVIMSPMFGAILDTNDDTIVRGKNEHEAGHARLTPHNKLPGWSSLKGNVVNALEDLRIERAISKLSGAIESDLAYLNRSVMADINRKLANGDMQLKPVDEALLAMHMMENGVTPAWVLSTKAQAYFDAAYPVYQTWKDINNLDNKLGFSEIEVIADKVIAAFKDALKNQEQNEDGAGGENGQSGNKSDKKRNQSQKGNQSNEDNTSGNESSDPEDEGKDSNKSGDEDNSGKADEGNNGNGVAADADNDEDGKADEDSNSKQPGNQQSANNDEQGNDNNGGENDGGDAGDEQDGGDNDASSDSTDSGNNNSSKPSHDVGNESEDTADDNADNGNVKKNTRAAKKEKAKKSDRDIEKELNADFGNDDVEKTVMSEKLKRIFDKSKKVSGNYIAYTGHDRIIPADEDKEGYENARQKISAQISMLSSYTEDALKAMSRVSYQRNLERGKIDRKKLVGLSKSLTNKVFYKTKDGVDLNVAVTVMIDESGSIGYMCYQLRSLAIAFSEVFTRLGIKFEVLGYTTASNRARVDLPSNVTRKTPMVVYEHKTFNEPYQVAKYKLGSINSYNCNIDGESLLLAFKRIKNQRTSRHVIFVLSDGMPNEGSCSSYPLYRHLSDSVKFVRNNGVEVYAFGIGTHEPEKFYGADNFIYLEDVEKLGTQFFRRFREIVAKR